MKNNGVPVRVMSIPEFKKILLGILLTSFIMLVTASSSYAANTYSQTKDLTRNLGIISDVQLQNSVSGTVSDETGQPMPGVSVLVKGTTQGTITNLEGKYTINNLPDDAVLEFSFVGMLSQDVIVSGQTTINVTLIFDAVGLDEVVVVGYGVQKKVNLSGAVDAINAEVLENRPLVNVAQGLQGVSPNLNIDFISGEPGQAAAINIRGVTSINGGDPLILIDGVPSSSVELLNLNPLDVEDITVLKDASSAAIYGARAAFGVVLITTKKGQSGRLNITYRNNFSWSTPTLIQPVVTDPYIYMRLDQVSVNNTPWQVERFTDEAFAYAKERSDNPDGTEAVRVNPRNPSQWEYFGNKNWAEELYGGYSNSQTQNIQIDGGTEKVRYYLSGSYDNEDGILKIAEERFKRYNLRTKIDYTPFEWLTFGSNVLMTDTERIMPSYFRTGLMFKEQTWFPVIDVPVNPDGTWSNTNIGREYARMKEGGTSNKSRFTSQSTFTGEARFFDNALRLNADFTFRSGQENLDSYRLKYQLGYGPDDIREAGNQVAQRANTIENYTTLNIYSTYNNTFGNHNVTALVGFNQEHSRSDYFFAERKDFFSGSLPSIALAYGDVSVNENIREWATRGLFYRLNYNYRERYIVEFNGRYDGSSRFPSDNRWGFFPSASAAWNVHKENFMNSFNNTISNLKLRASYGSLGNQNVSAYGYIPTMDAVRSKYIIGSELPLMMTIPPLVSANYSWETMKTANFGVDLGLLKNKIFVVFDIYQRETLGMLTLGKDLPDVLGTVEPKENAADLQTNGWELAVSYKENMNLAGKPLNMNIRLILSDSRAWITNFDNPNYNINQYYNGMEFGEIWGFEDDGFFQSNEEAQAFNQRNYAAWGSMPFVEGTIKWVDQDGNGIIEKGFTLDDPKDGKIIGNTSPRYRFGANLNFNWNGFDLSAFFQGIGKKDYYPTRRAYWGKYSDLAFEILPHMFDFYRAEDDTEVERALHSQAYINAGLADANLDAFLPVLQAWNTLGANYRYGQGLGVPTPRYLFNAAYIRLKNLTIGYTIPMSSLEKLKIQKIRLYVSGENIATWSPISFMDPEQFSGSAFGNVYPFRKRFSFGVNVNF